MARPNGMTKADEAWCRKCIWHTQGANCSDVACGYSLCYSHTSRVKLHYDRIGREDLEGMTYGKNCTEFMEGNPLDKATLLFEDPQFISQKGWEVLSREKGNLKKTANAPKRTRKPTAERIDREKFQQLRQGRSLREIGEFLGISPSAVSLIIKRGIISKEKAERILEEYGVDILVRHTDS